MISIIVAVAGKKRVIGKTGGMPWYIPAELKRFKEITMGHPIIMGRKTHESIGKALPGRTNIIITHDQSYSAEGCIVVHSLEEAIKQAQGELGSEEIFVMGGGQIYEQAIPLVDKLYLTYLDKEIEGDVFFPDYSEFKKKVFGSDWQEHEGMRYKFLELER
ncbi:MAG: dihydrofolate reductase [Microgenomates group bacterium Gr01-1014_7]|nr:MAG: dihydrofolate reductase [Microgenomates group bacterium Gr01-1014_7]